MLDGSFDCAGFDTAADAAGAGDGDGDGAGAGDGARPGAAAAALAAPDVDELLPASPPPVGVDTGATNCHSC